MVPESILYFFVSHTFASFEEAVNDLKLNGIKPVAADNLNLMFQHILFPHTAPEDYREYFSGHEDENIIAIGVTPESVEKFGKGQLEQYGKNGSTRIFIRFLNEEDVFPVKDGEFYEV